MILFKNVIILSFDDISPYFLMVIGQKNSLKPDSFEKYSFVHRIYLISGTSPQFQRIRSIYYFKSEISVIHSEINKLRFAYRVYYSLYGIAEKLSWFLKIARRLF